MYFFLKSFGPSEEVFDRLGFLREVVGDDGFGGEDFGGLVRVCFGVKVDEGVVGFGGEVFGGLVLVCFCGVKVDEEVVGDDGFGGEDFLDPVCSGEGVVVVVVAGSGGERRWRFGVTVSPPRRLFRGRFGVGVAVSDRTLPLPLPIGRRCCFDALRWPVCLA